MKIKLAIFGAGFWAKYQIAAWKEHQDVEIVAIYNRTREKAESLAKEFDIPSVYTSAEELLTQEKVDAIDVITDVSTHEQFVLLAAKYKVPVICQKPLAPDYETARRMVDACQNAGIPLFVHENWRWQTQLRELKKELDKNQIGKIFRADIVYANSFPVFENQPFLKELDKFILTDMGTHILDVTRFLLGEAESLYCQTAAVTPGIKGEDVADISIKMRSGVHCNVEISYASKLEHDTFPQVLVLIEGEQGSIQLSKDFVIKVTTPAGTTERKVDLPFYEWCIPQYALVQSSMVALNKQFLDFFQDNTKRVETTGDDNLKTLELVYKSYESADNNTLVSL
ncbi:MAG: Gfo/Idh/MocA family protein [Weeksellaceae bacterium]